MNTIVNLEKVTLENISQFLYREARCLDDEKWDEWLACYAATASFWMPAWDDDDRLTEDPQAEISLIIIPIAKVLKTGCSVLKPNVLRPPCQTRVPAIILVMLK